MNDNSRISPDDIRELKAEYAAAMLSDETLAYIAKQFEEPSSDYILMTDVEITEGHASRIRVERNGVEIANLSFELDPDPAKYRRKQTILIVGADLNNNSLIQFERQAEMLGIQIEHISAEAHARTQLPRKVPYLETMKSLQLEIAEMSEHLKSAEKLAANVAYGSSMFQDKSRKVHGQEAQQGYKVHGSRRGRNIKDDKSRKAQYSKTRK